MSYSYTTNNGKYQENFKQLKKIAEKGAIFNVVETPIQLFQKIQGIYGLHSLNKTPFIKLVKNIKYSPKYEKYFNSQAVKCIEKYKFDVYISYVIKNVCKELNIELIVNEKSQLKHTQSFKYDIQDDEYDSFEKIVINDEKNTEPVEKKKNEVIYFQLKDEEEMIDKEIDVDTVFTLNKSEKKKIEKMISE